MTYHKFNYKNTPGTVFDIIRQEGNLPIETPCGGKGTCGKCKIKIKGNLSPLSARERELLTHKEIEEGYRLACLTYAYGDFEVQHSEEAPLMKIETSGQLDIEDFSPVRDGYGIAIDIGTTSVALYLCNLDKGTIEQTATFPNPQRKYGADVLARINYLSENNEGKYRFRDELIKEINNSIVSFGIKQEKINGVVITGNTVMEHFITGYDARGIATMPFNVASLFGFNHTLPLNVSKDCEIYISPCIASYVGGDIVTGLVASGVDKSEGYELYIDIGTNGEIAIGGKDKITTCATAAGPAFEGANIECGMPSLKGAVSSVRLENNKIRYTVIGDTDPVGICGSGLIDAAALMLELGVLDESGRIEETFYIDKGHNIYITQKDIRQLQLAKAAICGGIYTLLHENKKTLDDITSVKLAGGFGSNINATNAVNIGLIPHGLNDKITSVGNAAGMGAVSYLLSENIRQRISNLKDKTEYIELSLNKKFNEFYIEQMIF